MHLDGAGLGLHPSFDEFYINQLIKYPAQLLAADLGRSSKFIVSFHTSPQVDEYVEHLSPSHNFKNAICDIKDAGRDLLICHGRLSNF